MTAVTDAVGADLADLMVVLDWNGTVMADVDRAVEATNEVLAGYGLGALSRADFRAGWALPLRGWLVGLGIPVADAAAAEAAWNAAMARRPAPVRPGAVDALAELTARGAYVAVVSAAGAEAVGSDVDAAGLGPHLHAVDAGVRDKAAHLAAHRDLRERAVYVGDTEYDVDSARRAGYLAVAITGGYRPRAALATADPDTLLDDLRDLALFL
jgi:phosphoglycolate phosphatase